MSIDLFVDNLLSPPVLFFSMGLLAVAVRSDLEIPKAVAKLFSIYLLWAIGFKGGVALRESGLDIDLLAPVIAGIVMSAVIPVMIFPFLKKKFGVDDATALAATYGSVSVVTFMTAADFLVAKGIEYGGEMIATIALMEAPPIIVALVLRQMVTRDGEAPRSKRSILHEAVTSGPVFLLLGCLTAGYLTGPERFEVLKPFTYDIFHGVLVLFLLEAGLVAGQRMRELRKMGAAVIGLAVVIPLISAVMGIGVSYVLGFSVGNALLFTILSASGSYIAVPAVMRMAVPRSNAGLYLPMSLGVTFPFNVCIGIPLYLLVIQHLWGGG